MNTILKILGLIFLSLYFTACAGNSGGGSSDGAGSGTPSNRVIDQTPHSYQYVMGRELSGVTGNAQVTWVCRTTQTDAQTYDLPKTFTDGNPNFGVLCPDSKNISIQIKNTGAINLIVEFTYDGVYQWQATVAPGQTYTLTRGF